MSKLYALRGTVQSFFLVSLLVALFVATAFANRDTTRENPGNAAGNISSLEDALADYQALAAKGGWPAFKHGKTIKPGESDPRIPVARQILTIMDDYRGEQNVDSTTLDAHLVAAVEHFQMRHGLEVDGALGKRTQEALSVSARERVAQMQVALERMKAEQLPDAHKYVIVNVPGYYLQAYENGEVALNSRVIVGKPQTSTPLFDNQITGVSFNPPWNVPPKIARNEMLGKVKNNPEYLQKSGFALLDSSGAAVDPSSVDWENTHAGNFDYRFRQRAGAGNALGKIKFDLPDNDNIYLHSTSSPKLFAKADRALSHGCIRVEMTRDLAHFVFEGMDGFTQEKVNALYDGSASRYVNVEPVPVKLVYWTSWVDNAGNLQFRSDIYGKDERRMAEILRDGKDEFKLAMK